MDSKTFVKEVERRNRAFHEEMDVEKSFMSIRPEDPVKVHKMVRLRLKQGLYNELRVSEVSAAWIHNSPLKAQRLPARQVDDEFRRVRWVQARLKEIGEEAAMGLGTPGRAIATCLISSWTAPRGTSPSAS
ncbi:MAG: hypothetical protein QGH70_06790 [Nitrospinota bacterium]|nr:hypothetical protein [Nitrospinota bacterium]